MRNVGLVLVAVLSTVAVAACSGGDGGGTGGGSGGSSGGGGGESSGGGGGSGGSSGGGSHGSTGGGSGGSSSSSSCSQAYLCINGGCSCSDGAHKGSSCCDPDDPSCDGKSNNCDTGYCQVCTSSGGGSRGGSGSGSGGSGGSGSGGSGSGGGSCSKAPTGAHCTSDSECCSDFCGTDNLCF